MEYNNEDVLDDRDNHTEQNNDNKPNAWKVDDDKNLEENDLEKSFTGDAKKPVMEGQGAGGQNFGHNNLTPAENEKNNPSQYAGNTNPYFDRNEPSEEHPEDENFKATTQQGSPDYDKAQPQSAISNMDPKPEHPEEKGNGENDRPHADETYTEGTVDSDETNIPGPDELPDQQKVGEDVNQETYDKDHIDES